MQLNHFQKCCQVLHGCQNRTCGGTQVTRPLKDSFGFSVGTCAVLVDWAAISAGQSVKGLYFPPDVLSSKDAKDISIMCACYYRWLRWSYVLSYSWSGSVSAHNIMTNIYNIIIPIYIHIVEFRKKMLVLSKHDV